MGLNCYKVPSLKDPILETLNISYLQDRYILGDELGWGQFGVIKSCFDMVTGESLACKSIAKDRLVSNDDLQTVKLEIEVMSKLTGHPNVVELKAIYEEEGFVHLVMELCAGGELFHRIEKCGRFCEGDACRLFKHLMEVILYCHEKGIVHRDLKPENILLATKSSLSEIKLADFGLATYINPGQSLHGTVGSPFYIAPNAMTEVLLQVQKKSYLNMKLVIQTKSVEFIPLFLCLASFFNGLCWTTYALIRFDLYIT